MYQVKQAPARSRAYEVEANTRMSCLTYFFRIEYLFTAGHSSTYGSYLCITKILWGVIQEIEKTGTIAIPQQIIAYQQKPVCNAAPRNTPYFVLVEDVCGTRICTIVFLISHGFIDDILFLTFMIRLFHPGV